MDIADRHDADFITCPYVFVKPLSGFFFVEAHVSEHGEEHVAAAAGLGDQGLGRSSSVRCGP